MHALLCTHHMLAWTGSELVVTELAEVLCDRGVKVSVYAPFHNDGFPTEALPDVVNFIPNTADVDLSQFDLVYSQHQTLSRLLPRQDLGALMGSNRPYFVFNHLSPFEPFEFPGPFCQADIADLIWCNSFETYTSLCQLGSPYNKALIVPNPCPSQFSAPVAERQSSWPRRILSVSNHLPKELAEAFEILQAQGCEITRIGRPNTQRRITPADIRAHDAIVTIGKTVQYALNSRVPVFCYDHFAGPGWINSSKIFKVAGEFNFSGRDNQESRSPRCLAKEIMDGYIDAHYFTQIIDELQLKNFKWDTHIESIWKRLEKHKSSPMPLTVAETRSIDLERISIQWRREAVLYDLIDREYGRAKHANEKLVMRAEKFKADREKFRDSLDKKNKHISYMTNEIKRLTK